MSEKFTALYVKKNGGDSVLYGLVNSRIDCAGCAEEQLQPEECLRRIGNLLEEMGENIFYKKFADLEQVPAVIGQGEKQRTS